MAAKSSPWTCPVYTSSRSLPGAGTGRAAAGTATTADAAASRQALITTVIRCLRMSSPNVVLEAPVVPPACQPDGHSARTARRTGLA